MSGGSLGYLCDHYDEIGERLDLYKHALDQARTYGEKASTVVADLSLLIAALEMSRRIAYGLRDPLKAIEWHISCDWSEDQARESCAKYRSEVK